jgi:DNA-directed RNA polymerase subunit M/transcription elongation factor TFIIS
VVDFFYRPDAREALARAKNEIASNDSERLKYAALELRMAIEALVYDRLQIYKDELTPRDYEAWQPRKIMMMLLDIDPWADKPRTIMMGREDQPGVEAEGLTMIGTENVLSMATIKKNYDALGSFLHLPTVKQYEAGGKVDFKGLQERLENIVSAIEVVLASTLANATFTVFIEADCKRCGERLRKRAPAGDGSREVTCLKCGAEYRQTGSGENKVVIVALTAQVKCMNERCGEPMELWQDEFKNGHKWKCNKCNQEYEIGLKFAKVAPKDQTESKPE